ncbi:MAG: efflux RND transporter periplasmic adaptor subunit [Immundisolibacterales bacterium]|nr:efflux RND transporter periplasmic adaptor subunit [Immundisolibacterales bacterium]
MRKLLRRLARAMLFVVPVAVAAAVVGYAVQTREGPRRLPPEERTTPVRVVTVPSVDVVPRALGYGSAQPGRVWEAVGEVSGTVIYRHPELAKGALLRAGTELLRIDPTDYRLAIAQIEASIRSTEAQLAVLDVREANTRRSLAIEDRSIDLARKELERKQSLVRQGTVSQATVDQEERAVLAGEQALQNLRNAMNLLPAERSVLEATRDQLGAQLETARRDLERTTIVAPFDCRIAEVNVEQAQFAARGKVLVVADSLDVAEVNAQVPIGTLLTLVPAELNLPLQEPMLAMARIREVVDLEATVRLRTGRGATQWPARFQRISDTVDPRTRTVGVIVAVDDPYRRTGPGRRPPLVKNMYVEVEIRGPPRHGAVVVPRSALHGRAVRVVDSEGRLRIREVETEFMQTNFVVVASGIEAGERVVVSDLPFAVDGMRLAPEEDEEALVALVAEAVGTTPVQ